MIDPTLTATLIERIDRTNALLRTLVLQDAAVALDLFHQVGLAQRQLFSANASIAPLATTTVVNLVPPSGWVGFWRRITVEPSQSRIFTMVVTIDGREELRDTSLVPGELFPERVWLPFFNSFTIAFTNDDAVATHLANVTGLRVFLESDLWAEVRGLLQAGVAVVCPGKAG